MSPEKEFIIPDVGEFDEAQYLEARRLIRIASNLFGDGQGQELGDNSEYERGMCELICERIGVPMDRKALLCKEIHIEAGRDHHVDTILVKSDAWFKKLGLS